MMMPRLFTAILWIVAQAPLSCIASSVILEAESGSLGGDWALNNTSSPAYIDIISNATGNNPVSAARVATYSVTFPAAGTYELYARIRVGPGAYDDDSMFYGNGFGAKSPSMDADWIFVNGLAGVGFSNSTDVVNGGGSLGSGMWKWINLSQYTGQSGFTVTAGDLMQTFEVGAREDGLDIDKFAFGIAGTTFTVAELDAGGPGTPPSATIDPTKVYQTIEGFGGAIAFYNGWVTAHPYKEEIYTNAFGGLNLSMLRLGNWYRYQGTPNFDPEAAEFVARANQILGRPVPIQMSSWAPPGFLKSNGEAGNGGTLLYTNGGFVYDEFAQYWYDSLLAYRSNGVSPTWISIQNEPDWEASYDSCIFRPTEGIYNGTNWAGYSNALAAVYLKLTNLPLPPKVLGPEPVGLGYSVPQNYAANMNSNHFCGFNYHLYHGSTDGTANGYINALQATTNLFPAKPRFMTEFGVSNMIESATLIHNCLTEGLVSGYNHWSLIWPWDGNGLVQIEFPWDQARWTNAPPGTPTQSRGYWLSPSYWAMKHFSYYITPGSRRIEASCTDANVKMSAYVTADDLRLVAVFINRNTNAPSTVDLDFTSFPFGVSSIHQTAGTNKFQSLGPVGGQLTLPADSLTTVVLDKLIVVGQASNPSPPPNATDVALPAMLSWTPGSNAISHAVYIGTDSNAVAVATPASPEYQGTVFTNVFSALLDYDQTIYWRADGMAYVNLTQGPVWSFTTTPLVVYPGAEFQESGGVLSMEAENCTLGSRWITGADAGASGGAYIEVDPAYNNTGSAPEGTTAEYLASYNFDISTIGNYRFWFRMYSDNANDDSFFWRIDDGSWIMENNRSGIGSWFSRDNAQVDSLSTGSHVLEIAYRENGTRLDKFVIQLDGLSNPSGEGPAQSPQPSAAPSPTLNISATPANIIITWPLASAGFMPQSRMNLVDGNWVNVTSPAPQIVGDQWQVTLPQPTNTGMTFYRLMK